MNNDLTLPSFLVIGAAKSSTTTIFHYLCKHPKFYNPFKDANYEGELNPKEPNFFSRDELYKKGISYYSMMFSQAKPDQICGEATTDYTKYPLYPHTAERISKHLPNVKLIYIMRHPVDRAYSYYVHRNRTDPSLKFQKTFEEFIEEYPEILDASDYMLQINRYLKYFPKESFLFLTMEDLTDNPQITMTQVFNFIDIGDIHNIDYNEKIIANNAKKQLEDSYRSEITSLFRKIPGMKIIKNYIPTNIKDGIYNILRKTTHGKNIKKHYTPIKMRPETREKLIKRFEIPNKELSEFLNRDLSHWSK